MFCKNCLCQRVLKDPILPWKLLKTIETIWIVVVQTVDILVDPRGYRIRFEDVSVLNPIDEAHLRKRASHTDIGVTA